MKNLDLCTVTKQRKRYTLKELLKGCTYRNMKQLNEATKWAREGKSTGQEVARNL